MDNNILNFMNNEVFCSDRWKKSFSYNCLQNKLGYYINIFGDIDAYLDREWAIDLKGSELRALADYKDYVNNMGREYIRLTFNLMSAKESQKELEEKLLELQKNLNKNKEIE